MRRPIAILLISVASVLLACASACAEDAVLDISGFQEKSAPGLRGGETVLIKLSGKVSHAQLADYHAVTPGVLVWFAELPDSKNLDIRSDETGWWSVSVKKYKGAPAGLSPVYEKKGWITTKSNVIAVQDRDITDLAIQYIDPNFFRLLIRPGVQLMIRKMLPPGADSAFRNAIVVTVGKSWASIHDDRLPHGDPGALCPAIPGAVGPLYFDESVRPNPEYRQTSVDGGVAWVNVPPGEYTLGAEKPGVEYQPVRFVVAPEDEAAGIVLYIASPPHGIQGDNGSEPGKP